ncbi:carboxypeptidase-like regulatory domain-containing protein [Geobacter sp.]|uniref:carboxypeptidase-like regulatory domain-containing protein n=1 Tax=Geobacter sp. TaxID=46610 RepID=UPI002636CFC9|nr:carboxypeptidase-like regulatory domain-containing protein [Geobacter sp.]
MSRIALILFLVLVQLCAGVSARADEVRTGTLTGQFKIKGDGPLADGQVFLFRKSSGPPPWPGRYWRVPDEIVTTDGEGRFTAQLIEGTYYMGAGKRPAGKGIGPLRDGDYYLPSEDRTGKMWEFTVKGGETTTAGTIASVILYKRDAAREEGSLTAIGGTVTDAGGKPVEGIMVFAFVTPGMVGKPLYVSERTGKDGRYLLRVHSGGTYYLKARDLYGGGAPKAGEFVGGHGKTEAAPVVVKSGETVKGIDFWGVRFEGRGPGRK